MTTFLKFGNQSGDDRTLLSTEQLKINRKWLLGFKVKEKMFKTNYNININMLH